MGSKKRSKRLKYTHGSIKVITQDKGAHHKRGGIRKRAKNI
jgi:hypothetical protein